MSNWNLKEVRQLGRVVTGKTPPKTRAEYYEGKELFVSPKDFDWNGGYVEKTQATISRKALEAFKNQVVPKNSVLFTSLSFGFGKMAIASRQLITNQQINSVIANDEHHFRFIYYLLRAYTPIIFSYNSGIDTPIVPKSVFEKVQVRCPDLKLQCKIAAILTAYDDLIEVNKRRIALLEKMAEELYREWFVRLRFPGYQNTRFVKGVPEGWEVLKFSDICNFIKGKTPSHLVGNPLEDYLPYVNAAYLRGQEREFAKRERNSVTCDHGDVLMLMDGSNSGLVFRAQAGIVASTFARIEMDLKYRHFIFEYLKATQQSIISNNTGSAVPHANKEFINRLIIFAPKDDQLLNSSNEHYQSLHDQCANLYAQNENLTKTRDLLLPRLISGKLSVEDLDIQFPPSMQDGAEEQESPPEARHA